MSLRQNLEKNQPLVAGLAFAALALAALLIYFRMSGSGPIGVFFYDLNTKTLVGVDSDTLAPATVDGGTFAYGEGTGGSAVQAGIFACSDDVSFEPGMTAEDIRAAGGELVWIKRYPLSKRDLIEQMRSGETPDEAAYFKANGLPVLMSDPTGTSWVPELSPEGQELSKRAAEVCDGGKSRFVLP